MISKAFAHLFKKADTEKYPLAPRVPAKGFRGKQVFDINLCISCGLCSRDCPAKAIEMVEVAGKRHPMFYLDRCIFCYQCAESCPRKAISSTAIYELATTSKASLVLKPTSELKEARETSATQQPKPGA
jgi:formate hydrogenlyase subunit 6/NADH:ubiquinone oxidoreductase subunit I